MASDQPDLKIFKGVKSVYFPSVGSQHDSSTGIKIRLYVMKTQNPSLSNALGKKNSFLFRCPADLGFSIVCAYMCVCVCGCVLFYRKRRRNIPCPLELYPGTLRDCGVHAWKQEACKIYSRQMICFPCAMSLELFYIKQWPSS